MKVDLTPSECLELLSEHFYAHLGCAENDEPYVLPITYIYKDGFLYGSTQEGRKVDIMRKNPKICIQVERMGSGLEWESVICWGMFEEVTDEKSMQDIKLLFGEQHGKILLEEGKTPVSPTVKNLSMQRSGYPENTVIYRMKPYRMTGKAEKG